MRNQVIQGHISRSKIGAPHGAAEAGKLVESAGLMRRRPTAWPAGSVCDIETQGHRSRDRVHLHPRACAWQLLCAHVCVAILLTLMLQLRAASLRKLAASSCIVNGSNCKGTPAGSFWSLTCSSSRDIIPCSPHTRLMQLPWGRRRRAYAPKEVL